MRLTQKSSWPKSPWPKIVVAQNRRGPGNRLARPIVLPARAHSNSHMSRTTSVSGRAQQISTSPSAGSSSGSGL